MENLKANIDVCESLYTLDQMPKAITTNRKKTRTTNILPIHFGAGATMHAVQKRKSESNNANLFGSDYAYCEARNSRTSTSTHSHTLPCTEHAFIYISNDLPHWTFVDAKTVASLHKPRGFIFIVALSEIYVINYKDR